MARLKVINQNVAGGSGKGGMHLSDNINGYRLFCDLQYFENIGSNRQING